MTKERRKTSLGVTLAWMLIGSLALAAAGEREARVLGRGVTIGQATSISALLAAPQDHAGKAVRIDGVITEVCARHGDWIKVAGPRTGSGILVQAEGSGFSFPPDCETSHISVEGVLEAAPEPTASSPEEPLAGGDVPRVCAAMNRQGVSYRLRATGAMIP